MLTRFNHLINHKGNWLGTSLDKFGWTKINLLERDLNLRPSDWRAGLYQLSYLALHWRSPYFVNICSSQKSWNKRFNHNSFKCTELQHCVSIQIGLFKREKTTVSNVLKSVHTFGKMSVKCILVRIQRYVQLISMGKQWNQTFSWDVILQNLLKY